MKGLYFDLIGGASGDMVLGSLIDSGLDQDRLLDELAGLNIPEFQLTSQKVTKNGFSATHVDVQVTSQPPERHLDQIREIIESSSLPAPVQNRSLKIFQRIAETEASIHNIPVEKVHLHELGGTDTIIDISGALLGLDILEISAVYASPIPLGRGFVEGAHGQIPIPSPATTALLSGVPVYGRDIKAELVTPTAAALLSELVVDFGPPPPMIIEEIGYGAGKKDLPIPNLLRVLIGQIEKNTISTIEGLAVLETNLDDLNPEVYPYVIERLFSAGALDVTLVPIQMKKNRPGTQMQVLCQPADSDTIREILYTETTTLGIKQHLVDRYALPRTIKKVKTKYGTVRVKVAKLGSGSQKISPEYEDCKKIAEKHKVPIFQVYQETLLQSSNND